MKTRVFVAFDVDGDVGQAVQRVQAGSLTLGTYFGPDSWACNGSSLVKPRVIQAIALPEPVTTMPAAPADPSFTAGS